MKNLNLIIEKRDKNGGKETYFSRLISELDSLGIRYKVITSIFPKFLPSWIRLVLFNFYLCSIKKDEVYFSVERLKCADIYRAGDGVHKKFLMIEKKSVLNPLHYFLRKIEKHCFENAKFIIANSNMVKADILQHYPSQEEKIHVIYNGINFLKSDFKNSYQTLSVSYPVKNKKILLFVGSGFKRKGLDSFLEIVSHLKDYPVLAFVLGKDKNLEAYKQLSEALGIEKKVFFVGSVENTDDYYTISDMVILPTKYDPFSNVVLEAMSHKNVVFTTVDNGAHEVLPVEHVMTNENQSKILNEIKCLLKDKIQLELFKKINFENSKKFSIERNVKQTIKLINLL